MRSRIGGHGVPYFLWVCVKRDVLVHDKSHTSTSRFCCLVVGGVLLFRMLPRVVSLALSGLASGFGMGPGVSLDAVATNKSFFVLLFGLCCVRYCGVDAVFVVVCVVGFGVLVPVTFSLCSGCSSGLSTQCSSGHLLVKLYLKRGFPLRCFQRLSCPYVAIQLCHWRDNWWTRGTSVPVLSY